MPNAIIVHVADALGNSSDDTIPLFVILYLLSVLRKIAIGTQLHEEIDVGLIIETSINLGQIGVVKEAVDLNPKY